MHKLIRNSCKRIPKDLQEKKYHYLQTCLKWMEEKLVFVGNSITNNVCCCCKQVKVTQVIRMAVSPDHILHIATSNAFPCQAWRKEK